MITDPSVGLAAKVESDDSETAGVLGSKLSQSRGIKALEVLLSIFFDKQSYSYGKLDDKLSSISSDIIMFESHEYSS